MHSFRLRYLLSGLLIYIQSAFSRTSGGCLSPLNDIPSRTILAGLVIEGTVKSLTQATDRPEPNTQYARFNVRKVLKGTLPPDSEGKKVRYITAGLFGAQEDWGRCIGEVMTGVRYIVFLQGHHNASLDYNTPFLISSFPQKADKKSLRAVRTYSCDPAEPKCVQMASVSIKPRKIKKKPGERVELRCSGRGRPTPVLTWYYNGVLLESNSKISIKTGKKSSRLRIKKLTSAEAGSYECRSTNVVNQSKADSVVRVLPWYPSGRTKSPNRDKWKRKTKQPPVVAEEVVQPSHHFSESIEADEEPCSKRWDGYCHNNGTCLSYITLPRPFCQCQPGYVGTRCEAVEPFDFLGKLETLEDQKIDRALTVTGLVVASLVLLVLFVAAYVMSRRTKSKFRKRQAMRLLERSRLAATTPSNGMSRPAPPTPAPDPNKPLTRRNYDVSTQTECEPLCAEPVMVAPGDPKMNQAPPPRRNSSSRRPSQGSQGAARPAHNQQHRGPNHGAPPEHRGSNHGPPPEHRGSHHGPPPEHRGSHHEHRGSHHGPPSEHRGSHHGPPPEHRGSHHGPPPEHRGSHHGPPPEHRGSHHGPPPEHRGSHHGPPPEHRGSNPPGQRCPSYSSLPRQNTAPHLQQHSYPGHPGPVPIPGHPPGHAPGHPAGEAGDDSPGRQRLSGVSSTPDMNRQPRRHNNNQQQAIPALDAKCPPRRSPSQISRTESALDRPVPQDHNPGSSRRTSDAGSRGGRMSVDSDARSDYDNPVSSDLEVNPASEASLGGLECDELDGLGHLNDSSSSSSSLTSREQALFQQHFTPQPSPVPVHEMFPRRPRVHSRSSSRGSQGNISLDNGPTFPSEYAYNPYANNEDNFIAKRYPAINTGGPVKPQYMNERENHRDGYGVKDKLLHDPDPEATVV